MDQLNKLIHWLMQREGHQTLRPMILLQNSVLLLVTIILFFTVYSFSDGLNSEPIILVRIGGVILIGLLLIGFHYAKKVYVGIKHGFHGSSNLIKILLLLVILGTAIYAYQKQNDIRSFIDKKNKAAILDKLNPIYFGNGKIGSEKGTNTSNYSFGSIVSGINDSIAEAVKPPSIDEIEQLTYQKVNAIRGSSLKWDSLLASLARKHSEDMAARNFFDHTNPDGLGPTERAKNMRIKIEVNKGSYSQIGIGENISMVPTGNVVGCGSVYTAEEIAECAAEGWRNSPGHYSNIIDKDYTETGIGVGYSGSAYYLTQDFR